MRARPSVLLPGTYAAGAVTGIAVFSGMLGVTLSGLFLTPEFYVALRKLVARPLVGHAAPEVGGAHGRWRH